MSWCLWTLANALGCGPCLPGGQLAGAPSQPLESPPAAALEHPLIAESCSRDGCIDSVSVSPQESCDGERAWRQRQGRAGLQCAGARHSYSLAGWLERGPAIVRSVARPPASRSACDAPMPSLPHPAPAPSRCSRATPALPAQLEHQHPHHAQ